MAKLAAGHPVGDPLTGHAGLVSAVAIGQLDGRDVIVSGSYDDTVWIWDRAGQPLTQIDLLGRCICLCMTTDLICITTGRAISASPERSRLLGDAWASLLPGRQYP